MKDSAIIRTLMRTINNKSQVNLTKRFENFGTNLLKYAESLRKQICHRYLIGSKIRFWSPVNIVLAKMCNSKIINLREVKDPVKYL